jgi:3-(3-hydroxy-phenyl)propionate hydroxylase
VNDHLRRRYLGDQAQAIYLIRPDQLVAARWISAKADEITVAMTAAWGA